MLHSTGTNSSTPSCSITRTGHCFHAIIEATLVDDMANVLTVVGLGTVQPWGCVRVLLEPHQTELDGEIVPIPSHQFDGAVS